MARKTASHFEVVPIEQALPSLEPPSHLSQDERKLFDRIVAANSSGALCRNDAQLLAAYVQSCFLVSLAYKSALASPSHMGNWVKATKAMVTLGRQLRLAPIGKVDPKSLTRQLTGRSYNAYPDLERIEASKGLGKK